MCQRVYWICIVMNYTEMVPLMGESSKKTSLDSMQNITLKNTNCDNKKRQI